MTEEVYSPGDVRRETDGLEGEIAEYIPASDRDEITRRELHSRFGDESAAALVRLVSDGIIRKRVRVVYRNNEKTVKTVSPALGEAELSEYLDGSRRTRLKKRGWSCFLPLQSTARSRSTSLRTLTAYPRRW